MNGQHTKQIVGIVVCLQVLFVIEMAWAESPTGDESRNATETEGTMEKPGSAEAAKETETVEEVDKVEVVEEVEVVEDVDPETASAEGADGLTLPQILGRQHPAVVHLPIGLVAALCLLALVHLLSPNLSLGKSPLVLSIAAVLSTIPAVVSGFLRAGEVFEDRPSPELLYDHRNLMIAMTVVLIASLALRIVRRDRLDGIYRYIYAALVLAAFALAAAGGHHGGQMVYGESYLPY